MSDKGFFATLRRESAVVPGKVRKFSKFLVIMSPIVFACLFLAAIAMMASHESESSHIDMNRVTGLVAAGLAAAIGSLSLAPYIMFVGYVYGDARRRGMPAGLWALLVVLIPNMIGFIVYFILRRSIFAPCSNCGRGAEVGQIYCSTCGHKLDLAAPPQPAQ